MIINDLKEAVEIEENWKEAEFAEKMSLPPNERVERGIAMDSINVTFDFFPQDNIFNNHDSLLIKSAKVFCDRNLSKFSEGSKVVLFSANYNFNMQIFEDEVDNFTLIPENTQYQPCYFNPNHQNEFWQIKEKNIKLRLIDAVINQLEFDDPKRNELENLFTGKLNNNIIPKFKFERLNNSQNQSISNCINSSKFYLIQGPPGTGKTHTTAHLTKYYLNQGKNVFITGPTHTAINNCINEIANLVEDKNKVIKIGDKHTFKEIASNENITFLDRLPYEKYQNMKEYSQNGIVIGGTTFCMCYRTTANYFGKSSKRLNNWKFDIAIIDEASQMSIPNAIAAISKSEKYFFIGDHKQLDPIIPSNCDNVLLQGSVFRRLNDLYPNSTSLLNISYRLNEHLIKIPNKLFYNNELTSYPNTKIDKTVYSSTNYSEVLNADDSLVLLLHRQFDGLARSVYEAEVIAELYVDLLNNGIEIEHIAVITPYRSQVREIKRQIKLLDRSIESKVIFSATVDKIQGQEKKYILYSMANTYPLRIKHRLDFFYNPNRLNVALTRATHKCIVLGNYKVFEIEQYRLEELDEKDAILPKINKFREFKDLAYTIKLEDQLDNEF